MRFAILLLIIFTSCQAKDAHTFQAEARPVLQELLLQLEAIETVDDMLQRETILAIEFEKLADIMIAAKKWQKKTKKPFLPSEHPELCQILQLELERLERNPLFRQSLEKSQEKAKEKLDKNYFN